MLRRRIGTLARFSLGSERPPTIRLPLVTSISFRSSLMKVDLPEPDAPTRKTNSPLSIWSVTSSRPMMFGSYRFVTESNTIIAADAERRSAAGSATGCSTGSGAAVMRSVWSVMGAEIGREGASTPRIRVALRPGQRNRDASSLARRTAQKIGVDQLVKVAVQHALGVSDLHVRAVIVNHGVRVQHVRPDLAAERDVLRLAPLAGERLLA